MNNNKLLNEIKRLCEEKYVNVDWNEIEVNFKASVITVYENLNIILDTIIITNKEYGYEYYACGSYESPNICKAALKGYLEEKEKHKVTNNNNNNNLLNKRLFIKENKV